MEEIIYLKKLDDYEEITNSKIKLPLSLKKIIFLIKNILNITTIRKRNEFNIWILPFQEKISNKKLEKCINKRIKKIEKKENIKIVIANSVLNNSLTKVLKQNGIYYFEGNNIKKMLIFKVLDYINLLQKKELNKRNITILVDESNEFNNHIIRNIAMQSKTTKIVSKKIYKFRELEQKLYDDYGIALQFSNSYKKSLLKSEIIINLDFNNMEINEYDINNNAIIINTQSPIKIKSRLFNGIVINSCRIKFLNDIKEKFSKENLLYRYNNLILYESYIKWETNNYLKIQEKIQNDNIKILNLIGNNGIINKKEFKIVN